MESLREGSGVCAGVVQWHDGCHLTATGNGAGTGLCRAPCPGFSRRKHRGYAESSQERAVAPTKLPPARLFWRSLAPGQAGAEILLVSLPPFAFISELLFVSVKSHSWKVELWSISFSSCKYNIQRQLLWCYATEGKILFLLQEAWNLRVKHKEGRNGV